jgi:uncharacterized membrane protein YsdA (DUF1294 family)/cold shock CspA family protein
VYRSQLPRRAPEDVEEMKLMERNDVQEPSPDPNVAGRLEGTVSKWDAERGFGWVGCDGGSFFAHIREFEKGFVPRTGDEVTFVMGLDPQGRPCVKDVFCSRKDIGGWLAACLKLLPLLILPFLANLKLPLAVWVLPAAMLPMSVAAWILCSEDKKRAEKGKWRVSETELHGLELFGGWPGAFLAQRKLRHKTRKTSYQAIFWSIVFLYQLLSLDVVLDHLLWNEAAAFWKEWFIPSVEY